MPIRSPTWASFAAPDLLVIAVLVAGCAIPSPYVSRAPREASATVVVQKGAMPGLGWSGRIDVYDFESGCPELGSRMGASGYNGSIDLVAEKQGSFVVPAGKPMVLRTSWSSLGLISNSSCDALVMFVPVNGQRYAYQYAAPVDADDGCRTRVFLISRLSDGRDHLEPEPSVVYPRMSRGFSGIEAPGLCASAKRVLASGPKASAVTSSPLPGPVADAAPASVTDGGPAADAASASAPANPTPVAPEQADAQPTSSVVAGEGLAPQQEEPPAPARPRTSARATATGAEWEGFEPVLPGTGLRLGIGGALGGDELVRVMFADGRTETLSAGNGLYGSAGFTVTPIWIDKSFGFGLGAEIGWKSNSVQGKNASIGLSRFPAAVWLQGLGNIADRLWFIGAFGVQTNLAVTLEGEGEASVLKQDLESRAGWRAEAGIYYHQTQHTGLGFTLCYTGIRYEASNGAAVDASSIGFGLTLNLRP